MLTGLIARLKHNPLTRNIIILATGSGIAQIFPLIASVFIARLYTVADIGQYAIYFSICTIISTFICLGYENVIYLAKINKIANNTAVLSFIIASGICFIFGILVYVIPDKILIILGILSIKKYLIILPLSIIVSTVSTLLTYLFNRQGIFKFLSVMKVVLASGSAFIQIVFGFMKLGAMGFILANITVYAVADGIYLFYLFRFNLFDWKSIRIRYLHYIYKRYGNFSLYMTPSGVLSSLSNELPNFLLMKFFGPIIVGLYSFGQKIIVLPINFIVTSIQDVFKKESASEYIGSGNCRSSYVKTFKLLLPFIIIAFVLFETLTPFVFKVAFGAKWLPAAKFVQITCPFFLIRAVSSILSFTLILAEKQKLNLLFLIGLFSMTFLPICVGAKLFSSAYMVMMLATICNIFCYLYYMKLSYKYSQKSLTG